MPDKESLVCNSIHMQARVVWIWRSRCFGELPYESMACTIPHKNAAYDDYVILWKQNLKLMG